MVFNTQVFSYSLPPRAVGLPAWDGEAVHGSWINAVTSETWIGSYRVWEYISRIDPAFHHHHLIATLTI